VKKPFVKFILIANCVGKKGDLRIKIDTTVNPDRMRITAIRCAELKGKTGVKIKSPALGAKLDFTGS